jgi:hypothetical protein
VGTESPRPRGRGRGLGGLADPPPRGTWGVADLRHGTDRLGRVARDWWSDSPESCF